MDSTPTVVQPRAEWTLETKLRVLRESIAALIALSIVIATSMMLYLAFTRYVASPDPNADKYFGRAKDLLLFINPLLGVVIGYYFNKVSTEARAEKAEATVATANNVAWQAKVEADRAKSILEEVVPAAQQVLNETSQKSPGTLSVGESSAASSDAQAALRAALQRAKQLG